MDLDPRERFSGLVRDSPGDDATPRQGDDELLDRLSVFQFNRLARLSPKLYRWAASVGDAQVLRRVLWRRCKYSVRTGRQPAEFELTVAVSRRSTGGNRHRLRRD